MLTSPLLPSTFLAAVGLLGAIPAQGAYFAMPQGYLSSEGDGSSPVNSFGSLANGRSMIIDQLRGQGSTVREIALRPDYWNFALSPATGRSWTNVTLRMGEADNWLQTSSFSQSLRTTPTLVFSSGVTWSNLQAIPATRPAPFGIVFPFTSAWTYTGTFDLAADFVFTGGRLANNAPWTSYAAYPLDRARNSGLHALYASGVPIGAPSCQDTGRTVLATLYTSESLWHPIVRTDVGLTLHAGDVGGSSILFLAGILGSNSGSPLPGVACQPLFVNLVLHAGVFAPVTQGNARLEAFAPIRQTPVGSELWFQAAWLDSTSGALQLTPATRQGFYAPVTDSRHHERFGTGDIGGIDRDGAPVCRYQR